MTLAKDIAAYQYFLRILKTFDIVLPNYSGTVSPLSNHLNRQCRFLPPGVDTTAFCPYPAEPQRVIDVYSIGRRSSETHTALLELASNEGLFYLYDTIAGDQAIEYVVSSASVRCGSKAKPILYREPRTN